MVRSRCRTPVAETHLRKNAMVSFDFCIRQASDMNGCCRTASKPPGRWAALAQYTCHAFSQVFLTPFSGHACGVCHSVPCHKGATRTMNPIDRRTLLRQILPGAAAAAVGVVAVATGGGGALMSDAEAMPLARDKASPLETEVEQLFQKTQAVIVVPPRRRRVRRRVWQCWWYRGRRVCGYRWIWV